MESKTILIDGVSTVIRPMDDNYIIGEDPSAAGVTYAIKCWPGKDVPGQWPNVPITAYFKKIMKAYGTSAITAWQHDKLVGFLPFMPENCGMPGMVFCVVAPEKDQTPLEKIESAEPIPFENLHPKVLKVQCASVSWKLYRKGIGLAMAQYLVDWAKENGWEKIKGWAFAAPDIHDAYVWLPSVQFWEKAGFRRGTARPFDPSDPVTNKSGFEFAIELK